MFDYDEWFALADADGDGRVSGAEAVHFFMLAGLPKSDLARLWDTADSQRVGYLDRRAFSLACSLIGALQQYGTITRDVYERASSGRMHDLPKPKMQGLELPERLKGMVEAPPARASGQLLQAASREPSYDPSSQFSAPAQDDFFAMSGASNDFISPASQALPPRQQQGPSSMSFGFDGPRAGAVEAPARTHLTPSMETFAPLPAPAEPFRWPVIGPSDWQRYQQIFLSNANGNPEARLGGQQVAPILLAMNAPKQTLKDIWEVSDGDKDGVLSWPEFVVAVYLTEQARNGIMPPSVLPAGQFPPFSMTAGTQQAPAVQQPIAAEPAAVLQAAVAPSTQSNAISTDGLMTSRGVRDELQAMTRSLDESQAQEEYTFRGPVVNVASMPKEDQELTAKVKAEAEKADRELWDQEMKERSMNLSAQAAQEVLANLAMFVRKCEAGLTEANYRANVAENQVIEVRQKCEVMQKRAEELTAELDEPIKRIEAYKKEYDELTEKLYKLEAQHAEMSTNDGSEERQLEQDVISMRLKVESKSSQIAANREKSNPTSAPQPPTFTSSQPVVPSLLDFGDAPVPTPAISPTSAKARSTFDEWDNWGGTTREEVSVTKEPKQTSTAELTSNHRKVPSEIPAVAAALGDSGGNFFDSIDKPPAPALAQAPPVSPPPSSIDPFAGDDPFGAPPPTPTMDAFDDPFGAAPSPGPTPPGARRFLEIDPFA